MEMTTWQAVSNSEIARPILPFLIKPYLQLGAGASFKSENYLELIWHLHKHHDSLAVEVKYRDSNQWQSMPIVESEKLKIHGIKKHYRYRAIMADMRFGKAAIYRILWRGYTVFSAEFRTPKGRGVPLRFAVVGDLADGGSAVKQVAHRLYNEHPDICIIAGDVTYKHGRVSEYLKHFFPVLNCDANDAEIGAPLMRSIPTAVAWGNHDVSIPKGDRDRSDERRCDLFGIDLFFRQPQNGPSVNLKRALLLDGDNKKYKKIPKSIGDDFLRRSNYFFQMGNAHFQVIDGNAYMNWENPELRLWLSQSLSQADCDWKFVVVHPPPFNIDKKYWCEQRIRLLSSIFEQHGVDVVFSGHSHMYARTHPLRFGAHAGKDGRFVQPDGQVKGSMIVDHTFKSGGRAPKGPIYVITGAGGKALGDDHSPDLHNVPNFMAQVEIENRSITVCQIDGKNFHLRQITSQGEEIDTLALSK